MCKCLEEEIEELKAELKQETERAITWRSLWNLSGNTISELRATLSNAETELAAVRHDLADTNTTLDKYRDMHVKMSRAKSDLTEERDLSRVLFQGVVSEYADLLDRYAKKCDDYDAQVSRYDTEHGEF